MQTLRQRMKVLLPETWAALHAEAAGGATCVVAVSMPGSVELPAAMAAQLKAYELARADRRRISADRNPYIVAHYLLARIVGAATGLGTASWAFEPDIEGGKPRLLAEGQDLHASLSHTRGAVAVAISRITDVGVDIEAIKPIRELNDIAGHVLTDRERHAVFGSADPTEMFTRLWTRKEAVAKAFGIGIRAPFHKIDALDTTAPLLPPELPGAISIRDLSCSSPCRLAVAVRRSETNPVFLEIPFDLVAEDAGREPASGLQPRSNLAALPISHQDRNRWEMIG
jgi:4'-phosphopantetheinyl transferase